MDGVSELKQFWIPLLKLDFNTRFQDLFIQSF